MSGKLPANRFQDTYETCRTKGVLFGEQRSTMAGKVACVNMCWMCVMMVGGLFDGFPVTNSSPPLLHSFVGIYSSPSTAICMNNW